VYVGNPDVNYVTGTWFTEEIKIVNAG
jgi:hypothetical protein